MSSLRFEQRYLHPNRPSKRAILEAMRHQATLADVDFLGDYLRTGCKLRKPWMQLMADHHAKMLMSIIAPGNNADIDIWWGITDAERDREES